jgi:hypothetical protein
MQEGVAAAWLRLEKSSISDIERSSIALIFIRRHSLPLIILTMASCWICLDDGADRCGKPPVRDCSCRGDDAGYATFRALSIVEYARRKSTAVTDSPMDFMSPWVFCLNCTQYYQHQQRIDLNDEFKWFVDEQYPECGWRHRAVQNTEYNAYDTYHRGAEVKRTKR